MRVEAEFFCSFPVDLSICLLFGSLELVGYLITTIGTESPNFYLTCGHGALGVNDNCDTARIDHLLEFLLGSHISSG